MLENQAHTVPLPTCNDLKKILTEIKCSGIKGIKRISHFHNFKNHYDQLIAKTQFISMLYSKLWKKYYIFLKCDQSNGHFFSI